MTTKTERRHRRRATKRHARRETRQGETPTYQDTVRALKRAANKRGESIADVLGALRMRAILNGAI
ncbi:MAG: hypothetical protein OXG35_21320 [Acidobacteria bacterium]|nr:hypothetical protein [Acidobacteriota bacterium]